jgi:hypothetical protein
MGLEEKQGIQDLYSMALLIQCLHSLRLCFECWRDGHVSQNFEVITVICILSRWVICVHCIKGRRKDPKIRSRLEPLTLLPPLSKFNMQRHVNQIKVYASNLKQHHPCALRRTQHRRDT